MSDTFTIFAYDINTNTKITELPGLGLKFGSRLNDAGPISFSLPLGRGGISHLVQPLLDYEGRPLKLYVDRDGVIQGTAYIAWTGNYDSDTQILEVGGREIRSLGSQRIQVADYSVTTYPAPGVSPGWLVAKVLEDVQDVTLGGPGSSWGVSIINDTSGLSDIVPGYPQAQYTMVENIVRDMGRILEPGAGGVDTLWTSAWDPSTGIPVDTCVVRSPRIGRTAADTGLIFNLETVIKYGWPTDAARMATTYGATGAGNGEEMPAQFAQAPGTPVGGLGQSPRLDRIDSTTAQSVDQVSAMATNGAQQYGAPLATPYVIVPTAAPGQPLGSWIVGDDARLYTPGDSRFPNGLDTYMRIVAQDVDVPDQGVPIVTLTLNTPPIF